MSLEPADRSTLRSVADGKHYVIEIRCLECGKTHTIHGDPRKGFLEVMVCETCDLSTIHTYSDYSIRKLHRLMHGPWQHIGGRQYVRSCNVIDYLFYEGLIWPED